MKTYSAVFAGPNFGALKAFASRIQAQKAGNSGNLFADEEDILKSAVTLDQMVAFYNHHHPAQPVKSFRDKATAAKRIVALAQAMAEDANVVEEEDDIVMPDEKKGRKAKANRPIKERVPGPGRGRKSAFAGARLYPAEGLTENPRRGNTGAAASVQIVIDNPGIT